MAECFLDSDDFCNSSCCSSENSKARASTVSSDFPWFENVKSDGSLFYFEPEENLDPFFEDSVNQADADDSSLPKRQRKSKLNPAEKFKKWMKGRKKIHKSYPLLKPGQDEQKRSLQYFDTFFQLKCNEIFIEVTSPEMTLNSNLSLAENLLGLKFGPLDKNNMEEGKCVISNIIPTQFPWCNDEKPDVKPGDWLKSVNDIDVNMNNVEEVLKNVLIPSKIKLIIMSRVSQIGTHPSSMTSKHNNLVQELLGDSDAVLCAKLQYQHVPHCLLYLSIDSETFGNDMVIYFYPDDDTPIFQLKGMFLTLGLMIADVASPPVLSCSVVVQDEIVHVGFMKEENNIMVLGLPASVATVSEVQHFSSGIAKLLKYQFSSLQKTFTKDNDEQFLDNFFTLFFEHYLSSSCYSQSIFSESHLLDILPSVHWLPLPSDLKTKIDDILSELESSDFETDSDYTGFYGNRRIFNIFGSCLFYKGYLLCSHLPKGDLLDIYSYLQFNHILELTHTHSVSQIIIWKEVFPSRFQGCPSYPDPEFQESHGRWFMLIIVMKHSILAVLLDDGGCALTAEGNTPPEPFYVEEVENTLFILQDYGITAAIEEWLEFSVFPAVSPDSLLKTNSQNLMPNMNSLPNANYFTSSSSHSRLLAEKDISPDSLLKANSQNLMPNMNSLPNANYFTSSSSHSRLLAEKDSSTKISRCSSNENIDEAKRHQLLSYIGPADGESDTDSSYSNDSAEEAYVEKRLRSCSVSTGSTTKSQVSSVDEDLGNNSLHQNSASLPNLNGSVSTLEGVHVKNSLRMISGFGNNLFYYLHLDPVEGIFVAPVEYDSSSSDSFLSYIFSNFQRSCLSMRTVFERSLRNGEITKANFKTKYGVNAFLQNAYEQGVLFQYNQVIGAKEKNLHSPISFWVIGRLFFTPEPREIYVCHQDTTAQDIVEMAFRLGFGLSF